MHICLLEIEGFRGVKSGKIVLGPHTVLLGANNVGKSTIVDALGLLFGRDGLVRTLNEYDFYGGTPLPESRIRLRATVTGSDEELSPLLDFESGGILLRWDPVSASVGTFEDRDTTQPCVQIGFSARFDFDNLKVETIRYFVDGEGDPFENPSQVTLIKDSHLQAIGLYLLPWKRTWDQILSFGSELFRRVLRLQDAMPTNSILKLREWLRNPLIHVEEETPFNDIVRNVDRELEEFFGASLGDITYRPTRGDTDAVLNALVPFLSGKGLTKLPLSRHGSGLISLQTLLLLLELGRIRQGTGQPFVLIAEEPELHLHPGHHHRVVSRIRGVASQSIVTTHSPQVAAQYKPEEILVLQNDNGRLLCSPLQERGVPLPDKNAIMRLYTVYRTDICQALMHQSVVIPEGETEFRWFKSLLNACQSTDEWNSYDPDLGINIGEMGLIPTQSSQVAATFEQFNSLIPTVLPLVDGDKPGSDYIRALIRLSSPPRVVAQLPENKALEDLLAWFLSPSEPEQWEALEKMLQYKFEPRTIESLASYLHENKTNWNIHERIVWTLVDWKEPIRRVNWFFRSLRQLAADPEIDLSNWTRVDEHSTSNTTVQRCIFSDDL